MSIPETRAVLAECLTDLRQLHIVLSQGQQRLGQGLEQAKDFWNAPENQMLLRLARAHLSQSETYLAAEGPRLEELTERKLRQATIYLQGGR